MTHITGLGEVSYNMHDIAELISQSRYMDGLRKESVRKLMEVTRKIKTGEMTDEAATAVLEKDRENFSFEPIEQGTKALEELFEREGRIDEPLRTYLMIKLESDTPLMKPADDQWYRDYFAQHDVKMPIVMEMGEVFKGLVTKRKADARDKLEKIGYPVHEVSLVIEHFLQLTGQDCGPLAYEAVMDETPAHNRFLKLFFGLHNYSLVTNESVYRDEKLHVRNPDVYLNKMTQKLNRSWRQTQGA